jgi:CheY-like chemotaxis protein
VRFLLIEDNLANADTFTRMLNLYGDTEITHTLNGIDGLRQARSSRFDLILIDFDLPDVHGTQIALTLARLMQRRRLPMTPLVALTAQSDESSQRRAARVGFDAFVGKPCSEDDLLRVIRQLTSAPRA